MNTRLKHASLMLGCIVLLLFLHTAELWSGAAGPPMPWNNPLQRPLDNLSGPTAQTLGMLTFVLGGITWGFSRNEE
jgi:type IV secretory pathway VirB2 component (pilin)